MGWTPGFRKYEVQMRLRLPVVVYAGPSPVQYSGLTKFSNPLDQKNPHPELEKRCITVTVGDL